MEQVFGVPTARIEAEIPRFVGFQEAAEDLATWAERWEPHGEFRGRDLVEEDPSFQQLIPYVALTCRGTVLRMRRLVGGGEERLHGKGSIGVGGHVNPEPPGPDPLLVRGLARELDEEVVLAGVETSAPELIGFLRDPTNAVGAVHFGLACRVECSAPVPIRETETLIGEWVPVGELAAEIESGAIETMETWSQFLVPAIVDRLTVAEGS